MFYLTVFTGFSLAIISLTSAYAEIIVPPTPGNLLTVDVQSNVTRAPDTHIYTYSYTIKNLESSTQELWKFALEITPGTKILSSSSPRGWNFGVHFDQTLVSWAAVEIPELPPGYIDTGNVIPSPYNLKPGETLLGFSLVTINAPADGNYYAQGFTKLPKVTGDVDELAQAGYVMLPFKQDSYNGVTTTPTILPKINKQLKREKKDSEPINHEANNSKPFMFKLKPVEPK